MEEQDKNNISNISSQELKDIRIEGFLIAL